MSPDSASECHRIRRPNVIGFRTFKRAWASYLHYLNIEAGGRDASRSRPVQAIDNITPHMFRHTYATLLYDSGVDIKSAQKFMGHADAAITFDIYTHLSKEQEKKAVQAFNAHMANDARAKNADA